MNDRDYMFVLLVTTLFTGTSFWPVVMGWVDLATLDGWIQLVSTFGILVLVVIVFTLGGAFGYATACVSRWLGQALLRSRSDERAQLRSQLSGTLRLLYTVLSQAWKLVWWGSWWLRRRSGKVQIDVAD